MPRPILYSTPEEKRKAAAEKSRRWRERHPERAKEAKRKWAEKNPTYNSEYAKDYAAKNPERIKAKSAAWRAANKERIKAHDRARFDANPDYYWEKLRKWREANPERVRAAQRRQSSRWAKANPEKRCAIESRRRAQMMHAYPAWADDELIAEAYALAQLRTAVTGIPWEVDHLVPLNSDLVCGLHCHTNLQVIPAPANLAKKNFWWPDMPGDVEECVPFTDTPSRYLTRPADPRPVRIAAAYSRHCSA